LIFRVRVSPRADRQIRVAAAWWHRNRPAAHDAFERDVADGFAFIQRNPYAGEAVRDADSAGVRRRLLKRIRYHLYYVVSEEMSTVRIVSFRHCSRRPSRRP
jgi:plasmid stabilization system protein ParE